MLSFLNDSGEELISLVFNGEGSNITSWFAKDRLISSPYDDIFKETQNFFSAKG